MCGQTNWQACWSLWSKWFITLFHNSNASCPHVVITIKAVVLSLFFLTIRIYCHARINLITHVSFLQHAATILHTQHSVISLIIFFHPLFSVCLFHTHLPFISSSLVSSQLSSPLLSSSALSPRIILKLDGATQTVVMVSTTKQHSMTSGVEPA